MKNQKRKCGRRWKKNCVSSDPETTHSKWRFQKRVSFDSNSRTKRRSILVDGITEPWFMYHFHSIALFTLFVQLLISKRYGNFVVFVSFFFVLFFQCSIFVIAAFRFGSFRFLFVSLSTHCLIYELCSLICVYTHFQFVSHGHFGVSLNDCGRFSYLLAWHSFDQIFGITIFFFSSMIIIYGLSVMQILCFAVISAVAEHKICMPNWPRYRYRYVYASANFNLIVFLFSFKKLVWVSHHIIIIIGDYFLNYNYRNFSDNICKQNHMVVAFDFSFTIKVAEKF